MDDDDVKILVSIFVIIVSVVPVTLLVRYCLNWFYKINQRVQLMEEQVWLLRKIAQAHGVNTDEYPEPKKD